MSLVHLHLALTHVPVAVIGLLAWALVRRNSEVARAGLAALAVTIGLGVLSLVAFGRFLRRDVPRWAIATLFVLTLGASGLMAVTANLGGQIRHTEISASAMSGREEHDEP